MFRIGIRYRTTISLLLFSAITVPVSVMIVGRIMSVNNSSAITYAIPSGYTTIIDPNFYDCAASSFKERFPSEEIPATGLTDEQLSKIKSLECNKSSSEPDEGKIADTKGLEKMTSLSGIMLNNNRLTSLDVSKNTELIALYVDSNQLTSLDLSNNTKLTHLFVEHNQFAALDISKNTKLTDLHVDSNQLTSLDLSNNTKLIRLYVNYNQLTSLDVSKNTELADFEVQFNQLTSLDVSKNTELTSLQVDSNQLTSLDVSKNSRLTGLYVNFNQLTSLDVSKNPRLIGLGVDSNQLTSLDVSKNTELDALDVGSNQLTSLDVSRNTKLTALDVGFNQLTSMDLSRNTALKYFSCRSNHISDITSMIKLENLAVELGNFESQIITDTGDSKVYELATLFLAVNGKLNIPNMAAWVNELAGEIHLDNATMNPDGQSITITDITRPATVTVSRGPAHNSVLTVNYDGTMNNFALSFDANGGTGAPATMNYGPTTDTSHRFVIPATVPTRANCYFLGWAESKTATTATIKAGDEVVLTADKTFYAVWADGELTWIQGREHVKKDGNDAIVKINYPMEHFEKLLIDGKEFDKEKYKLEGDSTIITIYDDYLDEMELGQHTLTAIYDNGSEVETTFIIDEVIPVPNTGAILSETGSAEALFLAAGATLGALILGLIFVKNCKKTSFN